MMLDPVAWLFTYLLIGALVWMCTATSYLNFVFGWHARHHGRLPTTGELILDCIIKIVLWPLEVVVRLRAWSR